tara:strand:+ start:174 stop:1925 length:1752 start_codon:yes stop_codon:yes gene_type:complete
MSILNNVPFFDSDYLAVLAEQGINTTYGYNGVISGKKNCGVNFSKLGIETLYNKKQTDKNTGNKTNPDEELSIFVMVHGGSPIDTSEEDEYRERETKRNEIKNKIMKQTEGGFFDFFYPIKTSMAKYRAFNLCADRIRTYTLMGKDVHFHNEFWRLHYLMYLKEDIIILILIYLAVEFHWISTDNNSPDYGNIYPYRKLYSNCPVKRRGHTKKRKKPNSNNSNNINYEENSGSNSGPNSGPNSQNPQNPQNPIKQQIEEGDTSILDVNIGFGEKEIGEKDIGESYICFMYTEKMKIKGQIKRDRNNDIIYNYWLYKINLKEINNLDKISGQVLHNLNEKKCLYLSDLILYIQEIIKKKNWQNVYKTYDLIYCQGSVDKEEIKYENQHSEYIQKGYELVTKGNIDKLNKEEPNKEEPNTKHSFYQKIFEAAHHHNKNNKRNDIRVLKRYINNDKILNIHTPFPDLLQNSNIFGNEKKELNVLNSCPNKGDDFKKMSDFEKMSIILENITNKKQSLEGGKRNKQKGKIKSKPKQEKKKIKNVVVKPKTKSTSNKVKDGRKGKYKCGGCGCTHKTKEALNKCKKKK